jgi:hypothetical protein
VQYWKGSGAELQAEKERLLGELEQAEEKNRRVQKSLIRKEEIDIERLEMSQSVEKRVKALELKLAEKAEELEVNLALKTKLESQTLKDTQEAEEKIKALELVTSQKTEELAKMKDSFEMMKSRAEEVGEEADSEVVVLLRRAQEAESWQATIREGFARIIEMHSDEPFEQTWQKVENILQSSPNQRLIANVLSSANLPGSAQLDISGKKRHILGPREDGEDEVLEVDQQTERICETIANSLTDLPLSQRIFNASKLLTRESVDWLPKVPVDVRDIVPFASIHDELSREDSLSSFNDPAELEMLLISTPDLEGPADAHNSPKASQGQKESSVNPSTIGQNVSGINTAMGKRMRKADGCNSERSNTVPMKFGDPFVDKTMKSEQSNPKRKVVSFEGPNDVDQAETGRSRRMSDSIDNSSGKEAEDKAPKRTQKRTYSRLRQSVAQEETSIDRIAQPIDNPVAAKPQVPIQPIKSDTEPTKPMKMARLSDPGPGRRLSPKGLASGSSKAKATATRARTKRTTRGTRYRSRSRYTWLTLDR